MYQNFGVICASLLGVSKEGRESIPLWRFFSPCFSVRTEKHGRPGAEYSAAGEEIYFVIAGTHLTKISISAAVQNILSNRSSIPP